MSQDHLVIEELGISLRHVRTFPWRFVGCFGETKFVFKGLKSLQLLKFLRNKNWSIVVWVACVKKNNFFSIFSFQFFLLDK
jgi:hypothetical protein